MASHEWIEEFREWCIRERDKSLESAGLLESGRLTLHSNHVDVSSEWAERNRRIAREMDDLIAKIEKDIGGGM